MRTRLLGIVISASLVLISLSIMVLERHITAEAWGLLLLTPFPIAFILSKNDEGDAIDPVRSIDWVEADIEIESEGVGDPLEAGFDIPVL